jgi:hypothetical protein
MSSRPGPLPSLILILGMLTSLGSAAGAWWSAEREERELRDHNDAALARLAAAYIAVVTPPTSDGGIDARRLVAAANTIAGASFWPGGFQMAVGTVALVADTIGLLPLPDSAMLALERGEQRVITTHGRFRSALVPLPGGVGQGPRGWAAAWDTLPSRLRSPTTVVFTLLALLGLGAAPLLLRRAQPGVQARRTLGAALGCLGILLLGLGLSVRGTARASTAARLLTARRLIEIAATAGGVKQDRLPEIAADMAVRRLAPPVISSDAVVRTGTAVGPLAQVVAATPRTRGGLQVGMVPVEARLGPLYRMLLLWSGLGALGLVAATRSSGLSAAGGLFHSAGPGNGRPSHEGRVSE